MADRKNSNKLAGRMFWKLLKWKPSIDIMESVEDMIEWHYMKNLRM